MFHRIFRLHYHIHSPVLLNFQAGSQVLQRYIFCRLHIEHSGCFRRDRGWESPRKEAEWGGASHATQTIHKFIKKTYTTYWTITIGLDAQPSASPTSLHSPIGNRLGIWKSRKWKRNSTVNTCMITTDLFNFHFQLLFPVFIPLSFLYTLTIMSCCYDLLADVEQYGTWMQCTIELHDRIIYLWCHVW